MDWFPENHTEKLGLYLNSFTQAPDGKVADSIATHSASENFIRYIVEETENGYGFVPFIGAGFSVSAGVPIINQFLNYLRRCIAVAVGAESDGTGSPSLWNPRTDNWPPFIDLSRPEQPQTDWENLVMWLVNERDEPIYQEAYGAMAEWRSSLHFLSRVQLDKPRRGKAVPKPVLGVPSQDVIDACLRQVLRANAPGLNHIMLATLSQLLRIDTILTTNFDDLTEKAFEESRNHLEVFDVHLGDKLPAFNAVNRVRSIVKINGSQNSLRADYSLDGDPPFEDRVTFSSYVAGYDLPKIVRNKDQATTRNHIILLGVALTESRTKGFLKHALHSLMDLKLFVVCYQPSDVQAVRDFLAEYQDEQKNESHKPVEASQPENARCIVLRHTDAGLLLLHLYQFFRKALPPANAMFPSITRLSLPRLPPTSNRIPNIDVETAVRAVVDGGNKVAVVAPTEILKVESRLAKLRQEYSASRLCLTLDIRTQFTQEEFLRGLGREYEAQTGMTVGADINLQQILKAVEAAPKPLLLLINAIERRSQSGDGADPAARSHWMNPADPASGFRKFLDTLCDESSKTGAKGQSISAVVLCRNREDKPSSMDSEFVIEFSNKIELAIGGDQKLVVALSPPQVRGVSAVAADLFRQYEAKHLCLWLELHDVHATDDLFEAFQEAAYRKLGETDWTPLYAVADNGRSRTGEIDRIADSSAKPLMLFIDAREKPGANRDDNGRLNGWLDDQEHSPEFITLLKQLTEKRDNKRIRQQRKGITVVLLCRCTNSDVVEMSEDQEAAQKEREKAEKMPDDRWRLVRMLELLHPHRVCPKKSIDDRSEAQIILAVLEWAQKSTFVQKTTSDPPVTVEIPLIYKRAFLNMLLALQRPRHLAICWDDSARPGPAHTREADGSVELWLQELEDVQLVRRKNGGFIWLHSALRERLRQCLNPRACFINRFGLNLGTSA